MTSGAALAMVRSPVARRRRLLGILLATAVLWSAKPILLAPARTPVPLALRVAHEYRLSDFQTQALLCVRTVEHGGPGIEYGVLHPDAIHTSELTQARWAAGTIKKRLPDMSTLPAFANRWAPIGAENDPRDLNQHWLPNMQACLASVNNNG